MNDRRVLLRVLTVSLLALTLDADSKLLPYISTGFCKCSSYGDYFEKLKVREKKGETLLMLYLR